MKVVDGFGSVGSSKIWLNSTRSNNQNYFFFSFNQKKTKIEPHEHSRLRSGRCYNSNWRSSTHTVVATIRWWLVLKRFCRRVGPEAWRAEKHWERESERAATACWLFVLILLCANACILPLTHMVEARSVEACVVFDVYYVVECVHVQRKRVRENKRATQVTVGRATYADGLHTGKCWKALLCTEQNVGCKVRRACFGVHFIRPEPLADGSIAMADAWTQPASLWGDFPVKSRDET